MKTRVARKAAALAILATLLIPSAGAFAQGNDQKQGDQKQKDPNAEARRAVDEIAEVGRQLTGPAANPECYWLGKKVINLMVRDDIDTAFRHLDLYDRFGCPGGHIQATFRCLVAQGADILVGPKAPDETNTRIEACWINPAGTPPPAAAAAAAPPAAAAPAPAPPAAAAAPPAAPPPAPAATAEQPGNTTAR
jgi:hypothetical protein